MVETKAKAATGSQVEFEREKWEADLGLREEDLRFRRIEVERSRWNNPLTIAVIAAALAGAANAGVAYLNGFSQRRLESDRAQQAVTLEENKFTGAAALEEKRSEAMRILEVIKSGDPDKAAVNLQFLLDTGLISGDTSKRLSVYLVNRKPGEGAVLPAPFSSLKPSQLLQPDDFLQPSKVNAAWICNSPEEIDPQKTRDVLGHTLRNKYPTAKIAVREIQDKDAPSYILNISGHEALQSPHEFIVTTSSSLRRVFVYIDRDTGNWGLDKEMTIAIDTALQAIPSSGCELSYG